VNNKVETGGNYPSPLHANYALGVLTIAYIFSYVDRQVLSLLVEPIRADLQITDFQMGLLQGMAFALFYTILGIPLGRLADRVSRKMIVGVGAFCWSLMTAVCGLTKSFSGLFIARIGVGVGEAGLSPAAYSLLSDLYPPHRVARAMAIYTMGITVGGGLAYLVGGVVIGIITRADPIDIPLVGILEPWQMTFLAVGLPGLLLVPLIYLMKEPPRRGALQSADGQAVSAVPFKQVLSFVVENKRIFFAMFVGSSMLSIIGYGTANWYPTFLIRTYGMSIEQVGLEFGLIYGIFGTIGAFGSAVLSEKLSERGYIDANMRVVMLVGFFLIVPASIGPLMPEKWMALCFAAVTVILLNAHMGITAAAVQQVTPNQMRGTVTAMLLFMTNIVGLGLGAVIIAAITDFVFADDMALRYSLAIVAIVVCPLAGVLYMSSLKPFRAGVERMRELTGDDTRTT
jgi:MFS family permease